MRVGGGRGWGNGKCGRVVAVVLWNGKRFDLCKDHPYIQTDWPSTTTQKNGGEGNVTRSKPAIILFVN